VREAHRLHAHQGWCTRPAPYGCTSQARLRRELLARREPPDEQEAREECVRGECIYKDPPKKDCTREECAREEAQRAIPVTGRIYIDDDEAEVVREIYRLYVEERLGTVRIARRLNALGHRTREGAWWRARKVAKLLADPKMAGWVTYDEKAYLAGSKKKAPICEQERHKGKHDAIVDRELWDKAERRRKTGRKMKRARTASTTGYPLTGAVFCPRGHVVSGKSGGLDRGVVYYACRRRTAGGPKPELGGCDAPIIRAEVAEGAVRQVLAELLGHPEQVHAYLAAVARQAVRDQAPHRERVELVERQIARFESAQERYYLLLEDTEPGSEDERAAMDRVIELRRRLAELRQESESLRCQVIELPKAVSRRAVEEWCRDLAIHLKDGDGLDRFAALLRERHDLRVEVMDRFRVRVSLVLDPADLSGRTGRRLVATARMTLEGGASPDESAEAWVERERAKDPRCACGCGGAIAVRPQHRSKGLPLHLPGHGRSAMQRIVDEIRAEGFLTAADVRDALGCSASKVSRLVREGKLKVAGERRCGKRVVRYFEVGEVRLLR